MQLERYELELRITIWEFESHMLMQWEWHNINGTTLAPLIGRLYSRTEGFIRDTLATQLGYCGDVWNTMPHALTPCRSAVAYCLETV